MVQARLTKVLRVVVAIWAVAIDGCACRDAPYTGTPASQRYEYAELSKALDNGQPPVAMAILPFKEANALASLLPGLGTGKKSELEGFWNEGWTIRFVTSTRFYKDVTIDVGLHWWTEGSGDWPLSDAAAKTILVDFQNLWHGYVGADKVSPYESATIPVLWDNIQDDPNSSIPGVLIVGPKTLKFIKVLGPDILFFVSKAHPISRLADINNPERQFAGNFPRERLYQYHAIEQMIGGDPDRTRLIGASSFPRLFQDQSFLQLFVVTADTPNVDEIVSKGGGLRVTFAERDGDK